MTSLGTVEASTGTWKNGSNAYVSRLLLGIFGTAETDISELFRRTTAREDSGLLYLNSTTAVEELARRFAW